MADNRDDLDNRQARFDKMIAEFRAAQRRRLVKQGIALGEPTEVAQRALELIDDTELPPTKIN